MLLKLTHLLLGKILRLPLLHCLCLLARIFTDAVDLPLVKLAVFGSAFSFVEVGDLVSLSLAAAALLAAAV